MVGLLLCSILAQTRANPDPLFATLKYVEPFKDLVTVGEMTYALMPPAVLAQEKVTDIRWSPDGRYLLFTHQVNHPQLDAAWTIQNQAALNQVTLSECNEATGKLTDLMNTDGKSTKLEDFVWLPNSDAFFVETSRPGVEGEASSAYFTLYRFSLGDSEGRVVVQDSPVSVGIIASPSKDLALLTDWRSPGEGVPVAEDGRPTLTCALLEKDGTSIVPIVPQKVRGAYEFNFDGDPVFSCREPDPISEKEKRVCHPIDPRTGAIDMAKLASNQTLAFGPDSLVPIVVQETRDKVDNDKSSVPISSTWMRDSANEKAPWTLIAANSEDAIVSPAMNAVAYSSQGALFVRELLPVDPALLKKLIAEETRLDAMNRAKQVALGVLMYSNDYDDNPPAINGWNTAIEPYLKDPNISNGFIYTYNGGNMGSVENPATTIMGYIQTSLGRAVAYVDGHVVWIPNG